MLWKVGKPNVVLKIFKEMQDKGVSPSFVTFNNVLLSLANTGRNDEALSVFQQMKDKGFVPDAMTFTILGRVYDKDPQLDKKQLVEELCKAGCQGLHLCAVSIAILSLGAVLTSWCWGDSYPGILFCRLDEGFDVSLPPFGLSEAERGEPAAAAGTVWKGAMGSL